jgi:hypothetical protein
LRRHLALAALCGMSAVFGCKSRTQAPPPPVTAASASASARANGHARLPEDPVAGARALAKWHEHLKEEERERKANYDRRRLKEHRLLLASLRQARERYESAKTKPAVLKLQADSERLRTSSLQRIDAIDHWRNSSGLLDDYAALLDALSNAYPQARLRALAGDDADLERVRRDVDARLAKADDWLAYAERAEDE